MEMLNQFLNSAFGVNARNLIDKLVTLLVDRRFILAVLVVAFSIFAPARLGSEEEVADQWFRLVEVLAPLITALFGGGALMYSWTKREPTGLQGYAGARKVKKVVSMGDNELIEEVLTRLGENENSQ